MLTGVDHSDIGAHFPSRVLQRNLDGDAIGGQRFHQLVPVGEFVASFGSRLPAGHAVIHRGIVCWHQSIRSLPDRPGEIHARDVSILPVRGADIYRISLGVGEYGDFLAAFQIGYNLEWKRLLLIGGHGNGEVSIATDLTGGNGAAERSGWIRKFFGRRRCTQDQARNSAEKNEFPIMVAPLLIRNRF